MHVYTIYMELEVMTQICNPLFELEAHYVLRRYPPINVEAHPYVLRDTHH